jgi:Divergent InlB B-repeat domain
MIASLPANLSSGYPAAVASTIEPKITDELTRLQKGIYDDITRDGSGLTHGLGDQNTDVEAAAERLGGATALLNGYVELGLPQSVASDDALHSLLFGAGVDAFAPADPTLNVFHPAFASDVPDQVLNYFKAAEAVMPSYDPALALPGLVDRRLGDLELAVRAHLVPTAGAQQASRKLAARLGVAAASVTAPTVAENDSLIVPTVDRLDEADMVLKDAASHGTTVSVSLTGSSGGTVSGSGISCPGSCSGTFKPGAVVTLSATPAAGSSFGGWSGACSGTGPCTISVGVLDQAVTATFGPATATQGTPSGSTPAPGPSAAPVIPPASASGAGAGKRATARCTVKRVSRKVLVAKPKQGRSKMAPGKLVVTVRCNRAARVTVAGTVTRAISRRHSVRTQLHAIRRFLRAGVAGSLAVHLPGPVLRQLAAGKRESLVLTLSVAGARRLTVNVGTLKPVR